MIPDNFKINIKNDLQPKSSVLYFPINLQENFISSIVAQTILDELVYFLNYEDYLSKKKLIIKIIITIIIIIKIILILDRPLHIVWPHRWEHDKNPEEFFNALFKLHEMEIDFRLHVIGEQFSEIPGLNINILRLLSLLIYSLF